MTVAEYIASKMSQFGYVVITEEVNVYFEQGDTSPEAEFSKDTLPAVQSVLLAMVPDLLLLPDYSEGDLSVKRDRAALANYYDRLCTTLGVPNALNPKPTVKNASSRW